MISLAANAASLRQVACCSAKSEIRYEVAASFFQWCVLEIEVTDDYSKLLLALRRLPPPSGLFVWERLVT